MVQFLSSRFSKMIPLLVLLTLTTALPHPSLIHKRDIFSDIGNFFDNAEMQVDMTVFQPIENFFTNTLPGAANYIVMEAGDFFMKAQQVVQVAEMYTLDMLVADLGHAIEAAVIDEVNTIKNLGIQLGQEVTADATKLHDDFANEFNNIIGPALSDVGKNVEVGLNYAGVEILSGLEQAGTFIENHPEIIAEIVVTVAVGAVTVFQPELIGVDAALIGEIASEIGADTAIEVGLSIGTDIAEGVADGVVDAAAEEVVNAADESLFSALLNGYDKVDTAFGYIQDFLDAANGLNDTFTALASTFPPMTQETFNNIEAAIMPYNENIQTAEQTYGQTTEAFGILLKAGKIIQKVIRDIGGPTILEARKQNAASVTSSTHSSNTKASATKSASVTASATAQPTTIPAATINKWVAHHYLSRTNGGKNRTKNILKAALKSHLLSTTANTPTTLLSSLPLALTHNGLSNITYPPTSDSHRTATAHSIAIGKAMAYNKSNQTVKIMMDPNAPKDVCLGVPKTTCFGNQLGKDYCKLGCVSRWYNQKGVTVMHY